MSRLVQALAIVLLPVAAAAQPATDTTATAPLAAAVEQASQGPMTVERIHNQFVVMPEFKWTEFDHHTSGLAGATAGVVFADAIFIGGAGYGMVTNDNGRGLAYGGLVLGWLGGANQPVGYSAKMLMGWGEADSTENVQVVVDPRSGRVATQAVRVHQDFFVFEPEANASAHLNRHVSITGGVGYRFTGHYYGYGYYGSPYPGNFSPDGWTGTIGVRISSGS